MIVFFSSVISTLYYLGVMQYAITRIALVMQYTMSTGATESIIAASNIFVGQVHVHFVNKAYVYTHEFKV